jgi:hypothetical protein
MSFDTTTMYPVNSSHVNAFGYDAGEMVLYVSFNNGTTYWYSGVDSSVYDSFMMADSKGKFIWQYLRGQYEYGQL